MPFFTSSSLLLPSSLSYPLPLSSSSSPTSSSQSSSSSSYFISFDRSIKILGIYFNSTLSWKDHFANLNKSIQSSFYQHKLLFNRYTQKNDSFLRFKILSLTIVPKLTYCILLFFDHSNNINSHWNSWNKRLAALTFKRFINSHDVKKLHLYGIKDWIKFKSVELIRRQIQHPGLFSNIHLTVIKKSYALRSNERILFNFNAQFGTIFHICLTN